MRSALPKTSTSSSLTPNPGPPSITGIFQLKMAQDSGSRSRHIRRADDSFWPIAVGLFTACICESLLSGDQISRQSAPPRLAAVDELRYSQNPLASPKSTSRASFAISLTTSPAGCTRVTCATPCPDHSDSASMSPVALASAIVDIYRGLGP